MGKKPAGFSSYLPIIIAVASLLFCFYLYRRLETNDTTDILESFMMNQRKYNTDVIMAITEIRKNIDSLDIQDEQPKEQNTGLSPIPEDVPIELVTSVSSKNITQTS